jgi:methylase of polypeptide subunit release factors
VAADTKLPAEVTAQPGRALYADEGGRALISRLLAAAPGRLRPGGRVLAEIDPSMAAAMAERVQGVFAGSRLHRDAGGRERVIEAWSSLPTNSEPSA